MWSDLAAQTSIPTDTGTPLPFSIRASVGDDNDTLIKLHLFFQLHVRECLRREDHANFSLSNCGIIKNVLAHMTTCEAGILCQVPLCSSLRALISHWNEFSRSDCPVCSDLKKAATNKSAPSSAPNNATRPSTSSLQQPISSSQEGFEKLIDSAMMLQCIQILEHAHCCRDVNCLFRPCQMMKLVLLHTRSCQRKTNGGCPICNAFVALCCYHGMSCSKTECFVPFCLNIRQKLKQQEFLEPFQSVKSSENRMPSSGFGMSGVTGASESPDGQHLGGVTGSAEPQEAGQGNNLITETIPMKKKVSSRKVPKVAKKAPKKLHAKVIPRYKLRSTSARVATQFDYHSTSEMDFFLPLGLKRVHSSLPKELRRQ